MQFRADSKWQPALKITDSFIPQVLKLADLDWKVPEDAHPARRQGRLGIEPVEAPGPGLEGEDFQGAEAGFEPGPFHSAA